MFHPSTVDYPMDYTMDENNPRDLLKKDRQLSLVQDDRHDSGLDSMKDEDYDQLVRDLNDIRVQPKEACTALQSAPGQPGQAWKQQVTEDGDT